jgi:hypothetical protein
MDAFIQIIFVLLILSMITEKITNLIKMRPTSWAKQFCMLFLKKKKKSEIKDEKEEKIRQVQLISVVVGIVVAVATRASIFGISDPNFELGWHAFDWEQDNMLLYLVADFFGSVFSGIFLSLGSKFFHDLLDLLLESKNLKRKLTDRESIKNLHTIEEFDAYIDEVEPVVVELEIEKYLKTVPQFKFFEYSEDDNAANVYLNDISQDDLEKLKPQVQVQLANKSVKEIGLNYISI